MNFTAYASSSKGNLYTLEDGQSSILIECGLPYKEMARLLPKPPTSYDSCVISHLHGDHCNKRSAASLLERGVPVRFGFTIHPLGEKIGIGTIDVKSFKVRHENHDGTDANNHGFIFRNALDGETCIFIIDTENHDGTDAFYCPIVPDFSPTIVAIECNYARDLMKPGDSLNDRLFASHMSLSHCIETLKSFDLSKTREIHLLHLSSERSDEARFILAVQNATGVPVFVAPERRGR